MIDSRELRIGNIVGRGYMNPALTGKTKEYENCFVVSIGLENILVTEGLKARKYIKNKYINLKPVELTRDWFLKLGAELDNDGVPQMLIPNHPCSFYLLDDGRIQYANDYAAVSYTHLTLPTKRIV